MGLKKIYKIISKNLKLLLRSKTSSLIIILAPLIIILLLGVAFDNASKFDLTIGVHSESFSDGTNEFVSQLEENDFKIVKYDSNSTCIDDIEEGVTDTCISFPPDLNFEGSEQKEITFYVDYSKINLVYVVMNTLDDRLSNKTESISRNLVSNLISKLERSRNELKDKRSLVNSLGSDTKSVKNDLSSVRDDLTSLNFNYNEDGLPIVKAKNDLSDIKSRIDSDLSSASDSISAAQSSSSDSKIKSYLNNASDDIGSARGVALGSDRPSLTKTAQFLTTIQNEIDDVRSKLDSASNFKSSSTSTLNNVDSKLSKNIDRINTVKNTFDSIINDLSSLGNKESDAVATPVTTSIKPINTESTYLNYLFPSLIILVLMFISILLGTTLVMMEKHSLAHFRNYISPTKDINFVLGTFLTNVLLVCVQLAIIFTISALFFSTEISSSILPISLILVLGVSFFTLWGMGIGYLFTSEETATLASISTGSIFLFMSNVIIPIESMPPSVRRIAEFNPFVILERMLREAMLFNPSVLEIKNELGMIAAGCLVLFFLVWYSQKLINKNYLQKMNHYLHKKRSRDRKEKEKTELEG